MKKDAFEQFIRDHREDFDELEPSPFLWGKIEQDIKKRSGIQWKQVLSRVAVVLVIFTLSFFANEMWHQYKDQPALQADHPVQEILIPELLEAEVYYTSKVEERLQEFEEYGRNQPELRKELSVDIEELDQAFDELKEDLKDDIANEEIVEAMIQNYRIKLHMLEVMIEQLKSNKDKETIEEKNEKSPEYEI